ncbi:MAG TPA: exopolysaccharide biosynthesis polyprenyl glycosylphosphotransferase [Gaiellaceae bacterium]|nr:exopolysaccharide biosynthesis polyprenyl glycosylphosphotransferase [Gaiellaceae bacterium]
MSRSAFAPAVDALVLAAAALVESVATHGFSASAATFVWVLLFPSLAVTVLAAAGIYRMRLATDLLDELRAIVGATAIAAMTTTALLIAGGADGHTEAHAVRAWLFGTVYLAAVRSGMLSSLLGSLHATPTLIVGAGAVGRLVAQRLRQHPAAGLEPVGFLDDEPLAADDPTLPVLGRFSDLGDVLERHRIGHVVFAFSKASDEATLPLVDECGRRRVRVTLVPRLFERLPRNLTIDYIGALPLVSLYPNEPAALRFQLKYTFDRFVAAALLVLLAPLLLVIAVGVAASVGTPVLFGQRRVGRDGQVFTMLKFRTMRGSAAAIGETAASLTVGPGGVEGEDRRTRLGRFLRRTSLDELPQLLNVVRGDMSLVGPRPERPELAELFREHIDRYGERQRLKAGMTGWAQIHGLRGKTSLADRIEWDNWYIENCSPWLDLKILLGTTRSLFGTPHAE